MRTSLKLKEYIADLSKLDGEMETYTYSDNCGETSYGGCFYAVVTITDENHYGYPNAKIGEQIILFSA